MSSEPVLPTPQIIALHLAQIGAELPGPENVDRDHLRAVAEALGDRADVASAHMEALQGVAHAVRPSYTEDRPETWLLCAVAAVLGGGERPGALVLPPPTDELEQWCDLLAGLRVELDTDKAPPIDAEQRAVRLLMLHSLGLWLGSVQLIQVRAANGEAVPNDPDALPLPGVNTTQH